MNKFKDWSNHSLTRGDCLKGFVVSIVFALIEMAVIFGYVTAAYEKIVELGGKLFHHKKQPEICE